MLVVASAWLVAVPELVERKGAPGKRAFLSFFAATIRNANTRAAYLRAVVEFLEECEASGLEELNQIEDFIVGAWIEHLQNVRRLSKPTVKLKLAALRRFFDHLVMNQVIPKSPAGSVRGPKVKTGKGKTPVLDREQLQQLLDAIDRSTIAGKRDFAWLTLAASSWCRVSACWRWSESAAIRWSPALSALISRRGSPTVVVAANSTDPSWLECPSGELVDLIAVAVAESTTSGEASRTTRPLGRR